MNEPTTIYQRPGELLRDLIRFDTTNPPGNEAECIRYIQEHLHSLGIETRLYEKAAGRPNLIARLPGDGDAPPLLLQGHVDVVPTTNQDWRHPPFSGETADGMLWGRGTLDMKGGDAMMIAAFLRAKAENAQLPGDVILCMLSDEETGGDMGAKFLVEEHPEIFDGVKYAIGEFGGFTMRMGGKTFYPIMVSEKQVCWMRATFHGPGGHGSSPLRGSHAATAKLGQVLTTLNTRRLPVHMTPEMEVMLGTLAEQLPEPSSSMIAGLMNPATTDATLDQMGASGRMFDSLLHNTISPNIISGGDKINVIPSAIELQLDGRLLPGFTPDQMMAEVRELIGEDCELELIRHDAGTHLPNMALFDTLASILQESDADGTPIPMMLPAVTDARFFARLGIQTYGFLPMHLPEDLDFMSLIHAADERIPAETVAFGAEMVYQALLRFHE